MVNNLNNLIVISGGQTGVDLAGLWAAKAVGIPTGGKAPRHWRTQIGAQPELGSFFGLTESNSSYYGRTIENVRESDLTLIIAQNINSSGTRLTLATIEKHQKPVYTIDPRAHRVIALHDPTRPIWNYVAEDIAGWLAMEMVKLSRPLILNIAGNSDTSAPRIFEWSFLALLEIFRRYFVFCAQSGILEVQTNLEAVHEFQKVEMAKLLNNKFSVEQL